MGDKLLLKLNIYGKPIANKYCEGHFTLIYFNGIMGEVRTTYEKGVVL